MRSATLPRSFSKSPSERKMSEKGKGLELISQLDRLILLNEYKKCTEIIKKYELYKQDDYWQKILKVYVHKCRYEDCVNFFKLREEWEEQDKLIFLNLISKTLNHIAVLKYVEQFKLTSHTKLVLVSIQGLMQNGLVSEALSYAEKFDFRKDKKIAERYLLSDSHFLRFFLAKKQWDKAFNFMESCPSNAELKATIPALQLAKLLIKDKNWSMLEKFAEKHNLFQNEQSFEQITHWLIDVQGYGEHLKLQLKYNAGGNIPLDFLAKKIIDRGEFGVLDEIAEEHKEMFESTGLTSNLVDYKHIRKLQALAHFRKKISLLQQKKPLESGVHEGFVVDEVVLNSVKAKVKSVPVFDDERLIRAGDKFLHFSERSKQKLELNDLYALKRQPSPTLAEHLLKTKLSFPANSYNHSQQHQWEGRTSLGMDRGIGAEKPGIYERLSHVVNDPQSAALDSAFSNRQSRNPSPYGGRNGKYPFEQLGQKSMSYERNGYYDFEFEHPSMPGRSHQTQRRVPSSLNRMGSTSSRDPVSGSLHSSNSYINQLVDYLVKFNKDAQQVVQYIQVVTSKIHYARERGDVVSEQEQTSKLVFLRQRREAFKQKETEILARARTDANVNSALKEFDRIKQRAKAQQEMARRELEMQERSELYGAYERYGSRRLFDSRTGPPPDHMAYPNGRDLSRNRFQPTALNHRTENFSLNQVHGQVGEGFTDLSHRRAAQPSPYRETSHAFLKEVGDSLNYFDQNDLLFSKGSAE
eukprot:augustus_masked-scaffold_15-processed-gene-3.39-mRNA-1 protein AED:1.00 eAED:1.00 QI:0/-1/0/0/-1/1/1/0/751